MGDKVDKQILRKANRERRKRKREGDDDIPEEENKR